MASVRSEPSLSFEDVFEILTKELCKIGGNDAGIEDSINRFSLVCNYNVPHGKKNRGLAVLMAFKHLTKESLHTPDNLFKASVIGWCIEFLQACFLVADDIMDHSLTRRGRPCWYKQENVGLIAINDSLYLESAIFVLLKKYFREESYYVNLMELFHEVTMSTILGQNLDLQTAGTPGDFTNFTDERYMAIVTWKTAYYSFYLPVAAAMYMAGIMDEENHKNAQTILLHMGAYFQIQDDYLDCYGDPTVTGKIGTDIEDNKCGWLIIHALKYCDMSQRKILKENYGVNCPEKVEKVKQLYKELHLEDLYKEYEENSYKELMKLIEENCGSLPQSMFTSYADKIYKRIA